VLLGVFVLGYIEFTSSCAAADDSDVAAAAGALSANDAASVHSNSSLCYVLHFYTVISIDCKQTTNYKAN